MNIRARGVAAGQGGLLTRRDALDAGMLPSEITAAVRRGDLVVVRRGVYADSAVWDAMDEFRGRPRLMARAAVRTMHRGWVLSHDSAALELDLQLLRPADPHVHITRPGYTSAWTRYGVKHHYARFRPSQLLEVDGFPVLDMARTAVDIGREHGEWAGVVACDSAMRHGTPRSALIEAHLPMDHWPGIVRARNAVDLADPRAENAAESLGRILLVELGIGEPDPQFPVSIETGIVWCDIRVGNHIFEVDGRIKYRGIDAGGVATRPVDEVLWEEKKRERLICAEGLGMSRILWEDLWGAKRELAKGRLRAEYDVTLARFGPTLNSRLDRQAAEIRDRLGRRDRLPRIGGA